MSSKEIPLRWILRSSVDRMGYLVKCRPSLWRRMWLRYWHDYRWTPYPHPHGFTNEDVALCDLLISTERAFGPTVGNWLTEDSRLRLKDLRDRVASLLPPSED